MGNESSNMAASGDASSRGWSGSSNSSSSDQPLATSMSPPQLMRRMSGGVGAAFPSLKLTDTLMPQQTANPVQSMHASEMDSQQPRVMSDTDAEPTSNRSPSLPATPPKAMRSLSTPSDIPQPTATIDEFTPGVHPRASHVTWMTHPWHKTNRLTGGNTFAAKDTTTTTTSSPPLTQVLGMSGASASPMKLQRRMSTGSMLPPKENPFDAQPDVLHREMRYHSKHGTSTTDAAPSSTPPRFRTLSAEAADKFAGGFPW